MAAAEITAEKFAQVMGYEPEGDDLERCNCDKVGEIGHTTCGWCEHHNLPQFACFCAVFARL